jgi:hypothetical protein
MRLVIFGSRDFALIPNKFARKYRNNQSLYQADLEKYEKEYLQVVEFIKSCIEILGNPVEIVEGEAEGVDLAGRRWAIENDINIKPFQARWNLYGKRAGFLRNVEMADYSDCGIAVIKDKSKGSMMMLREMQKRNKIVLVKEV